MLVAARTDWEMEAMARALTKLADDIAYLRDNGAPSEKMLAHAPMLNDWNYGIRIAPCLLGSVVDHPLLGCRPAIRTSEVFVIDGMSGWVRTWSRWYRLGLPKNRQGVHHG